MHRPSRSYYPSLKEPPGSRKAQGAGNSLDPPIHLGISQDVPKPVFEGDRIGMLGDDLVYTLGDGGRPFELKGWSWNEC